MAGLLSRFTNFLPNTTILSNDHNQELNRIVNLLNGTTTNLKTVLKTSDAGDPPLELDQLSTGPIQKWFQGGILKAQISNAGNYLFNQSGGFIGDQSGNELLTFVRNVSAVNNFQITNAITANGPVLSAIGDDTNIPISIAPKGTGQVFITGSSPVRLPTGVAPTNDDDAARKKYVDDRIIYFSLTFRIDDPSIFPVNDETVLPLVRVPVITGGFVTKITIIRASGTHAAGGSVTFQARKANNSNIGSGISFNDTNAANLTVYTEDFADVAISEGEFLTAIISARSGTVNERSVSINIEGFRKVQ